MLMKLTTGLNITNILPTAFCMKDNKSFLFAFAIFKARQAEESFR